MGIEEKRGAGAPREAKPMAVADWEPMESAAAMLPYMVCGISFRRSRVEVREKASIPGSRLQESLRYLHGQPGVKECMILSTCNRTELYLSAESGLDGKELFLRFVREVCRFDPASMVDEVYVLRGMEAVEHLFRVASSLDSMVVGEPQILGQTKAAFRAAEKARCVDRDLHRWVPRAFAVAKRVRSESGVGDSAVSVSSAAVQLATRIFEDLNERTVVLLGAGEMGERAALQIRKAGASPIVVVNRTLARGQELAARCSGIAVEFEQLREQLTAADIVICSTDSDRYVLGAGEAREIMRRRSGRPMLLLDISVPRNIDPAVGGLDGAYLFNVDDLKGVVHANLKSRESELSRAERIVREALESFRKGELQTRLTPSIVAIRNQVRSVCEEELARLYHRVPAITAEQGDELEVMLHRIAQKILHPAIRELKAGEESEPADIHRGFIERLFGIEHEEFSRHTGRI